ncbi:MAG: Imm41 family immunity protein [Pseudomonadota bacterium]
MPADAIWELERNLPRSDSWEPWSFVGCLHGDRRWDQPAYWRFEWAVVTLADEHSGRDQLPRDLMHGIFSVLSYSLIVIGSHQDPTEAFELVESSSEDLRAYRDRLEMLSEGFFRGAVPDLGAGPAVNPLLK